MVQTPTGQFPRQLRTEFDSEGVVLGSDADKVALLAPFAGTVQAVNYVPVALITGAATNNRTVSLINTGQTGVGTTVMATLNFGAGITAAAETPKAITLSVVAGALDFAANDVLVWRSTHIGTGIADPGGVVDLTVTSV